MKVLLVQPKFNPNIIGAGIGYLTEPLALEVLAASIPEHDVSILDMRIDTDLNKTLDKVRPDIAGVTSLTSDVYVAQDVLSSIKKYNPNILTVIGGHHPTLLPQDFYINSVDVIVIGEGEFTFKELVQTYQSTGKKDLKNIKGLVIPEADKWISTGEREMIKDLDLLPVPARPLTSSYRDKYFRGKWRPIASLSSSKGCPFRCSFCSLWKIMKGKYKTRSAGSVVNEIKQIQEHYIDFAEDNFLHDLKRAEKIYELIKADGIKKTYKLYARSDTIVKRPDIIEKWKEIGMELILIGLESFRDNELKDLNKRNSIKNNEEAIRILQANDVEIAAYFIVNPDYTQEDFEQLGDYVINLKLTQPIFTVLTPLPGTDLYEQTKDKITTDNYELFDFVHSVLPTRLPKKEFYQSLADLYKKTYSAAWADKQTASEQGTATVSQQRSFDTKVIDQLFTLLSKAHEV